MLTVKRAASLLAAVLACLWASWWTNAQEPAGKQGDPPALDKDEEFWFTRVKRRPAAAAQLVLARNPLTVAALRLKSLEEMVWEGLEFTDEFAPALNPDWLEDMVDNRPLPDIRGKSPEELPKSALPTYHAFSQALTYAFQYPPEAFKKSARENADITFSHLWIEPRVNRGKVVPVKGRLVRIRKREAPWPAKLQGVHHYYEAWLFGETKHSFPYCLWFTTLPDGLEVAEEMRKQASFEGYYMGRFTFRVGPAAEQKDIDVPTFVGPTLRVSPTPARPIDDTPFSLVVLIGIVAMLVGLVAAVCGMSWWFRKGDRAIQAQLTARQEQQALEMMENAEAGSFAPEANVDRPPPPMAHPVDPDRLPKP